MVTSKATELRYICSRALVKFAQVSDKADPRHDTALCEYKHREVLTLKGWSTKQYVESGLKLTVA